MRAPKRLSITILTTSGAIACGAGDIAAPAAHLPNDAAAVVMASEGPRPFHGRIAGTLTAVPPFAPGSSDVCNRNFSGDPAAPGPSISLFDRATGTFAHLGKVALEALSCLDPASPTSSGQGTITAPNGDRLYIAFQNTSQPDPADPSRLFASGPQWVTGGTGRFESASGTQWCTFVIVLLSPSTGRIEGSCEGFLVY
ncbi:MAG: hypothetical protein ACREOG_18620 [Gemmatimonadaceae bacterium]